MSSTELKHFPLGRERHEPSLRTIRSRRTVRVAASLAAFAAALLGASQLMAQDSLRTAQSFGVLGATTVTNTGPTTITGDLGVSPGTAITDQTDITLHGAVHATDQAASQAQIDANHVFTTFGILPSTAKGQQLGGLTLTPGVYSFTTDPVLLDGNLTLDFNGDPTAMFVFQIAAGLTTGSGSSVSEINGGPGTYANVFWLVGSSATLGTTTQFQGSIIALTSITLDHGANISCGRAIALNGAVTMDNNVISTNGCSAATSTVPEPSSMALLGTGMVGLVPVLRRRRNS